MGGAKPQSVLEIAPKELAALRDRIESGALAPEDFATLVALLESYSYVTHLIDKKSTTLDRLRKILFGAASEKTADILARDPKTVVANETSAAKIEPTLDSESKPDSALNPLPGHGRNGAADYPGAERVPVPHESLQPGDRCPDCAQGTVYEVAKPGVLIRLTGQSPVQATIYELQKVRCQLCGKVFTAKAPPGVGPEKYDPTVAAMIGMLKYGKGVPFHRVDGLQEDMGVPLPASTQWQIVAESAAKMWPVREELIRQAAQGEVLFNDDTTVKILERMGKTAGQVMQESNRETSDAAPAPSPIAKRTGLFTSGVVATGEGRRIALFLSGHQHAGENLQDVLRRRASDLPPPIQMCDALSRNRPGEFQTILANCLAHARRQFVDVHDRFPEECKRVLEALELVYRNDALALERKLSADARLRFHQAESGPPMASLREWLPKQFDERRVEPHSGLGAAIQYLLKHWEKLTLFLRVPGAPLDNNLCERALKKAILHRKNALFYRTQKGATVGDLYMSLIHTCELCGANSFDYLTQLQRHADEVAISPDRWLPWNYRETLQAK